jgi:diguanylate cyclase (GGDEF)-like protein
MQNSASILAQFNQMQDNGYLSELEKLKKENRNLERLIDDIYSLTSYTQIDTMLSFTISKLLDYFIPQFLAFIMQPPRQKELRQYCYRSMQKTDEAFSYITYSTLVNYFEHSERPSYNYCDILKELDPMTIPQELTNKDPVIILPLRGIGGIYGIVILSEKTIGRDYTVNERQYVLHLFSILSLTLQNGLHYESSITEPKTNLFTPDYFSLRLNSILALTRRKEMQAGVLMIDIDFFKHFNDTWGHLAGDKVLVAVANILKKLTRIEDCVARFGGEEFVVLLLNCSRQNLFIAAERIRLVTSELCLSEKKDLLSITVSIGGYHIDKDNRLTGKEVIDKADQAMYESKQEGRNRCTIHSLGLYSRAASYNSQNK